MFSSSLFYPAFHVPHLSPYRKTNSCIHFLKQTFFLLLAVAIRATVVIMLQNFRRLNVSFHSIAGNFLNQSIHGLAAPLKSTKCLEPSVSRKVIGVVDELRTVSGKVGGNSSSEALIIRSPISGKVDNFKSDEKLASELLSSLGCQESVFQSSLKVIAPIVLRNKEHVMQKASLFRHFGLTMEDFVIAMRKDNETSHFISQSLVTLEAVFTFLRLELKVTDLSKIVRAFPALFGTPPQTLRNKKALWERFGIQLTGKKAESYFFLFGYSDKTIEGSVEALHSIFRGTIFPETDALAILLKQPRIGTKSKTRIMDSFHAYTEIIGVNEARELIKYQPRSLFASRENILGTYSKLEDSFGKTDSLTMILTMPEILSFSWENLREKVDYIVKEMQRNKDEIVKRPCVLKYSKNRLVERHEALKQVCKEKDYSLLSMLVPGDTEFAKRLTILKRGNHPRKFSPHDD